MEAQRYPPDEVFDFCCRVLECLEVPGDDARHVAGCLVQADLRGVGSHGVIRLPVYAGRIRRKLVNPRPAIQVRKTGAAAALVDGDNGLGPVVGAKAMETAIDLATGGGVGFAGVRGSNHFGGASYYVRQAIGRGFIGCATSNAPPHMAPFGGKARFLGTIPLAVGIPAGLEEPLIFDASSSVVARGKIIVAAQEDQPIPAGWAIDPDGHPTQDPRAALAGSVLPFGGPKGSAISFLIDILCGVLTGAAFAHHLNTLENLNAVQNLGQAFAAIRTDLFLPAEEFAARMDEILRMLKTSPPAPGVPRVLAPGEIETQNEASNRRLGIPLVPSIVAQLATLGDEVGVTFPEPACATRHSEVHSL